MSLILTQRAETMMRYAFRVQPTLEVGGFGKLELLADGKGAVVTDILIPPQEVGSTAVDFKRTGMEWMMVELMKRGETLADWNLWWHSHHSMGAFASGTDTDTLEGFAPMLGKGWAIGLVGDLKDKWVAWLNVANGPWLLTQKEIEVVVLRPEIEPDLKAIVDEMMESVTKEKSTWSGKTTYVGSEYTGGYYKNNPRLPAAITGKHERNNLFNGINVVWCAKHTCWDDICPEEHTVLANARCNHTPNCGTGNKDNKCWSNGQRKKRRQELQERLQKADREKVRVSPPQDARDDDSYWEGWGPGITAGGLPIDDEDVMPIPPLSQLSIKDILIEYRSNADASIYHTLYGQELKYSELPEHILKLFDLMSDEQWSDWCEENDWDEFGAGSYYGALTV